MTAGKGHAGAGNAASLSKNSRHAKPSIGRFLTPCGRLDDILAAASADIAQFKVTEGRSISRQLMQVSRARGAASGH